MKCIYSGTSLLWTLWDLDLVLITEVSSIQRSFDTLQYYNGIQNGVLIIEISAIQRFVIERFHCTHMVMVPIAKIWCEINAKSSMHGSPKKHLCHCRIIVLHNNWDNDV